MKPYSGRRLSPGCGPRSSATAHRTHYLAAVAAFAVLLAMCAASSNGWAASAPTDPPTSIANVIGANGHDFCDAGCVMYDSSQAPGEPVTLDGSQSFRSAVTGSPLVSYAWTVDGSAAGTSANPTLAVNLTDGNHTVDLVVTDQLGAASPAQSVNVNVVVPNAAVIAGGSRTVADTDNIPGETVLVDGTQSTFGDCGPNCQITTYHWTVNGQPSNITTSTATFRLNDGANTVSLVNDDARFAADAAAGFTILTDAPDRDYFNWSVGFSAQFPYGIAAFIDYQAMAGLALTTLHDTSMGVRIATRF